MKITFGEMREMGLRGVLVYCHCGHHLPSTPAVGLTRQGSRISSRGLSARAAAAAAPMSGQASTGATSGFRS
jgi:hypothetical protein